MPLDMSGIVYYQQVKVNLADEGGSDITVAFPKHAGFTIASSFLVADGYRAVDGALGTRTETSNECACFDGDGFSDV